VSRPVRPRRPSVGPGSGSLRPAAGWQLRPRFTAARLLALTLLVVLLATSAQHLGLPAGLLATGPAIGKGLEFTRQALPVRLERARRVRRLIELGEMRDPALPGAGAGRIDPRDLPLLGYIEERPVDPRDPASPREPYFVEPLGYLRSCLGMMAETLEMALWGTLLAILLAAPLAGLAARGYAPSRASYTAARAACSLLRAVPELILALVLVVMYGPGPVAGILALGLHTSGFLGKFFADDIENADPRPQQALRCTGSNRLKVLALAVLPQVMPQYVAYVQYILERNVRTATILGVVGAGGIGFELMARFKNGEYDSVATILLVVFAAVFLLEQLSQRLRARLIR
jgi:phosphonate transport system permease protein